MIVHTIDMERIDEPGYSKVYEAKMLELLPEWEKFSEDPFGRNVLVKKTKSFKKFKLLRTYLIFYKPIQFNSLKEEKVDMDILSEELKK